MSYIMEYISEIHITFAPRILSPAEKYYSQIKKEALGVVFAVKKLEPPTLCNGIRLVINNIYKNLIDATIITSNFKNERVFFFLKIPLNSSSTFHYEVKKL